MSSLEQIHMKHGNVNEFSMAILGHVISILNGYEILLPIWRLITLDTLSNILEQLMVMSKNLSKG